MAIVGNCFSFWSRTLRASLLEGMLALLVARGEDVCLLKSTAIPVALAPKEHSSKFGIRQLHPILCGKSNYELICSDAQYLYNSLRPP